MVMAKLAPGFRFCPTDEELIIEYLKPKVLGDNWCNFIQTVKLYDPKSTPWHLFDVTDDKAWTDSPQSTLKEKYLYVFTKLSKLRCSESNKGSVRENTGKKAGCGTWEGKTPRKPIKDQKDNVVIGEQRMLVFVINNVGDQFDLEKAGHFRMHEYSLSGVNKGLKSADGDDIVLCKITFSSSKKPVFKLDSKSTHSGPTKRGKGQDIEQSKNVERSTVGDSLERTMNSISTSVDEINSCVAENIEASECLTAENLFVMDSGVGDSKDYLGAADQFDDGSLELNESGWDASFTDSFIAENLFVMDSGVGDSNDYLGAADQFDDGSLELNESGWDASFTGSFMALLNSEEGELVEDISQLGKRKIEEESFCRGKKMCF